FDQRLSNALAPVLASDTDPDDAAGTPAFRDQRARPHQESLDLGDDEDVAGGDVACGDVVEIRVARFVDPAEVFAEAVQDQFPSGTLIAGFERSDEPYRGCHRDHSPLTRQF